MAKWLDRPNGFAIVRGMYRTALSDLRRSRRPELNTVQLARMIGCAPTAVSRFENGRDPISLAARKVYARALGVSLRIVDRAYLLAQVAYGERLSAAARAKLMADEDERNRAKKPA